MLFLCCLANVLHMFLLDTVSIPQPYEGTHWYSSQAGIVICCTEHTFVSGYRYRGPRFDPRRYQIF